MIFGTPALAAEVLLPQSQEVEIKFRIADLKALQRKLRASGFRRVTPPTHEFNTLYDLPGQPLRKRGEILRLRKYGKTWLLTHKAKGNKGRHKTRVETETVVADGPKMAAILDSLGFRPTFIYEKFRAEWTDGAGHVVLDQTPLGDIAEIEGPPAWIDATARNLGVTQQAYLTDTYADLFVQWKRQTKSSANAMTFTVIGKTLH